MQENVLYELAKLDRKFDMVVIYTLSKDLIRVRNKNKEKRRRNKKVNFRNSIDESSYEHIGLSSNNSNDSFLSEYSHTLDDGLMGLSKQRLTYPKKTDYRSPQYKLREKEIFKPSADCFK